MGAHNRTLEHANPEYAGLNGRLTRAEAVAEHVDDEVTLVLMTFARHPGFARIAERVSRASDAAAAAAREASRVLTTGRRRDVLVELLLVLASEETTPLRETAVANKGRTA